MNLDNNLTLNISNLEKFIPEKQLELIKTSIDTFNSRSIATSQDDVEMSEEIISRALRIQDIISQMPAVGNSPDGESIAYLHYYLGNEMLVNWFITEKDVLNQFDLVSSYEVKQEAAFGMVCSGGITHENIPISDLLNNPDIYLNMYFIPTSLQSIKERVNSRAEALLSI